jgi:hypothetical protein
MSNRLTRASFGGAVSTTFRLFKGRVERREALSNKLLELIHQSTGLCVSGVFPALHPAHYAGQDYAFWFWTVNGVPLHPDPTVPNPILPPEGYDCVSRAIQWYYPTGPGNGPPTMFFWAFDMKTGTFASEAPAAAPPEAVGQNHLPTAGQAWTIVAKDSIGSGSLAQPFHHWWKTGSAPQAPYDKQLDVPQGVSGAAIAFYGTEPGDGVGTPVDFGDVASKPTKDALEEVKAGSLDFKDLFDVSIYMRRVNERLDRLEHEVTRGRSFISGEERPRIGANDPEPGGRKTRS